MQIAEGLIRRHSARRRNDGLVRQFLGFLEFPGKQQSFHFRQILRAFGVVSVALFARPYGVFIELKMFRSDTAKYHCTEAAVADRKGFIPGLGWLLIPEDKL